MDAYTNEQLQAELERRRLAPEQRQIPPPPKPLETPQWAGLLTVIGEYMKFCETDYNDDHDFDSDIAEAALVAVYGPKIWGWLEIVMK